MAQAGLLKWANDIRHSMANDPGRQFFRDQIQMHGFLFLDDYLDNILAGARQDALIDLVKTPSRKKAITKQPRTASKLKNVVAVLFNDDGNKENTLPVNSFHQTLLQAKIKSPERCSNESIPPRPPLGSHSTHVESNIWLSAEAAAPPNVAVQEISSTNTFQGYPAEAVLSVPSMSDQNELSVIAEDDEPTERSRSSVRIIEEHATVTKPEPAGVEINAYLSHTSHNTSQTGSTSASADTFHSIILDSPSLVPHSCPIEDIPPLSHLSSPSPPSPVMDLPVPSAFESVNKQPYPPTAGIVNESYVESDKPDFNQGGTDKDAPSAEAPQQQSTVPQFPILPAPIPLHKSLRGPEQPPVVNPITPRAALGSKRTSWLKKAREAKALDVGGRKTSIVALTGTGVHSTLKRKSSDFFSGGIMLEPGDDKHKVAKSTGTDIAPLQLRKDFLDDNVSEHLALVQTPEDASLGKPDDMLGQFKKTVEGFRTRVGQSNGKSLGGAAAATLAEARAAAEARVVERNSQHEDDTQALALVATKDPSSHVQGSSTSAPVEIPPSVIERMSSTRSEERLSLSELVVASEKTMFFKDKQYASVFQPPSAAALSAHTIYESSGAPSSSASTTNPPLSVFNKAQPVFRPPSPKPIFNAPPSGVKSTAFSTPASISVGLAPRLPSPPATHKVNPLSAQSTLESLASAVFDSQNDEATWLPSTQDTEYDNDFGPPFQKHTEVLDEDDSWPMDEKLAEGVEWTFGIPFDREDSLTWSSAPTQSQKLEQLEHEPEDVPPSAVSYDTYNRPPDEREAPEAFRMETGNYDEHDEAAMEEESDTDPSKMTVSLVGPERSQSQLSLASSVSSQSHVGFLGQASKLMSSVLGTGKKPKPEVKSLQRAATAAKREQEEKDKKATMLKNMETRRQLVLQKKVEEEKARATEQEKKLKEEAERRKREREEHTDKRLLKPAVKKDEDTTKKRKLAMESEKKSEMKKPTLKVNSNVPGNSKSVFKLAPKPVLAAEGKGKLVSKFKAQTPSQAPMLDDVSQPSQLLQSQMAARAKAQIEAATVPSESIELPDVPSEYSDSDDEERKIKARELPLWAQSPELRQALENQATINPDDIFGPVPVLRMEEVFRTRTSRFRARTSSANWVGTDRLTQEEQTDYVRRMGYKS
ncbi:uncharacterized protein BT62DRAFT_927808 [Guyanagaster necrorhizus]|uniref:Inner centromere protein ARK-binding domain-containing protein n=1 Tax=Guyanagaster necrorhizus TaxID=856835 RepID=A0A9P8AWF6_9AGAR|nr:uncharacterized protein BT62DRAFT_927808 [Guyanagaster necrorhizus MCA 3950]KAG7450528.1 hypothetical protein BT62DRAFT_927808 [Guyanagaster necrorhizus MCA 3950]